MADKIHPTKEEPFMKPKVPFQFQRGQSHKEKCELIKKELRSSLLYWSLKRSVKGELIKSKYALNDVKELIPKILDQHGLKVKLKNEIYRLNQEALKNLKNDTGLSDIQEPPLPNFPETLDVVEQVRKNWAIFLKDQIMSISHQLKVPLYIPQKKEERKLTATLKKSKKKKKRISDDTDPASPLDTSTDELPKYTGVYGPSKLFETCVNIHNSNHERTFSTNIVGWGLIKLELKSPTLAEFRKRFTELDPSHRQVGLDDSKEWFSNDAINHAKKLSSGGYIPVLRKMARTGIPSSLRSKIWKQLLGISNNAKLKTNFENLLKHYKSSLMLVDDMILNDVKRTCDDENYFVFEHLILIVMQAFSRDSGICDDCVLKPVPLYGIDKLGKKRTCYPVNGIVPFEGLSLLSAPICYIYNSPVDIYYVFRELYTKFFCTLHIISSHEQSLIPLCKCFEDLLQNLHPQLYYHLLELNIHPLDIAVNWIFHAFAGYLNIDQLLIFWDRLIGFEDLTLLPVLSCAIFLFRAKFVLQTTNQQEIFDVFSDFSTIEVVSLLQTFLFKTKDVGLTSEDD